MAELTALSVGWGKQTWTLLAMMAINEIPRPDLFIFADTQHEHEETYEFIRRWTPWLGEHGIDVATVVGRRTDVVREDWGDGAVLIPAFTVDSATGKEGQVKRQCTHDWKIVPIRRYIRAEMAQRGIKVLPGAVEMWQGISWDEALKRMRSSEVAYIENKYPLVDLRMTRADCIQWLESHGLPVPPKSSCSFCPFKSLESWRQLKRKGGPDWEHAVQVDENIRYRRSQQHGLLYVHPARKPLPQAIDIPEDHGARQGSFFDLGDGEASCDSGYCFN